VGVRLLPPEQFDQEPVHELDGLNLDRLDIECQHYTPAPELLSAAQDEAPVSETLVSHLLKSNCLVTGQPDWGSVQIRTAGRRSTRTACCLHRELSQPQRIP
jgi:7-cyano-7-deazaguanine reductase